MLFGGFGAPPPRRRGAADIKAANQGGEAAKPATTDTKTTANITATVTASNVITNVQQTGQNTQNIKMTESKVITSVNKSTDSKGGSNSIEKGVATITTTVVNSTTTNGNLNNSGRIVNAKQN